MKIEGSVALVTGANRGIDTAGVRPGPRGQWRRGLHQRALRALHDDLNLLYPALEAQFASQTAN